MAACTLNLHPLTYLPSLRVHFEPQTHPGLQDAERSRPTRTHQDGQVCVAKCQRFFD